MSDVLEWVEKAALDNLRGHVQNTEGLARESAATLTVLMAMMSGAFALATTSAAHGMAGVVLTIYLAGLCVVLVTRCLMIKPSAAVTNEPKNLQQEGFSLDALRKVELRNIQGRINDTVARNNTTAAWLNGVRLAAAASPLLFLMITVCLATGNPFARVVAAG